MDSDTLTGSGPLTGVRILDLTQVLAGPYCSMLLADMGADAIKIERPPDGDPMRTMPPFIEEQSSYFMSVNRGKRSIVLDLTRPAGLEVFYDLTRQADVVLDNFRAGVTSRLGIDYASLTKVNSRIITCSISAFGSGGPYQHRPAFDLVIQAMSGAMSVTGEPGRPPVRMGLPMGDLGGALFGALGILGAVLDRQRTGRGQMVDVSLLDSLTSLLTYMASAYYATGAEPGPVGSGHHSLVPYQAFETADGYLVIAVLSKKFWKNLCRALERETLIDDPRFRTGALRTQNREALNSILQEIFLQRPRGEWLDILTKANVPCGPVNSIGEILSDPQIAHRDMVVTSSHPAAGEVHMAGTPLRFSGSSCSQRAAPLLGQHTREVLREVVQYSTTQIDELQTQGVIGDGQADK